MRGRRRQGSTAGGIRSSTARRAGVRCDGGGVARGPAGAFRFGWQETDADGVCAFQTVMPGPRDAGRARGGAPQSVLLRARPVATPLHAHLLRRRSGAGDRCRPCRVPADRRGTLVARRDDAAPSAWRSTFACRESRRPSFSTYDGVMGTRLIDTLGPPTRSRPSFRTSRSFNPCSTSQAALAPVQAPLGIIPASAAEAIVAAARAELLRRRSDRPRRARVGHAGRPAGPGPARARASADAGRARFVHFGATSQDVSDTAFVLCSARGPIIGGTAARLAHGPARAVGRACRHRHARPDVAASRPADHLWFEGRGLVCGLRRSCAAGGRVRRRADSCSSRGAQGRWRRSVRRAWRLAGARRALGLHVRPPWHAHRDRLAASRARARLHGHARQDRPRRLVADAGRSRRSGGARRRIVHDAAQAQSRRVRDRLAAATRARARGVVPHRHGAGARARRRQLACRVADACGVPRRPRGRRRWRWRTWRKA